MTPHRPADGPLPRLTKPQMTRLVEIGNDDMAFATVKEKATSALVAIGALETFVEPTLGGRYRKVRLTPLGIRTLAGLPGAEFDRFRELIAKMETAHVDV